MNLFKIKLNRKNKKNRNEKIIKKKIIKSKLRTSTGRIRKINKNNFPSPPPIIFKKYNKSIIEKTKKKKNF